MAQNISFQNFLVRMKQLQTYFLFIDSFNESKYFNWNSLVVANLGVLRTVSINSKKRDIKA